MEVRQNPLGSAPLGKLLVKFAVPSIISMLVSALYNIVDQIFIGQGVGMYGNAATNVAFPLTTLATAVLSPYRQPSCIRQKLRIKIDATII